MTSTCHRETARPALHLRDNDGEDVTLAVQRHVEGRTRGDVLISQVVSSKQHKLGLTQELFFSRISESTTGYTFTPCVGSFTSHGIEPDKMDHRLLVSLPKDKCGVDEIAYVSKRR